jgi:hypothetical protein
MQTDNENQSIFNESATIEGSSHQLGEQELDAVTGGRLGRFVWVRNPSPESSPESSPDISPVRHELRLRPRPIQRTMSSPAILASSEQSAHVAEERDVLSRLYTDSLQRSKSFEA